MTDEKTLDALSERVPKLENWPKIAAGVALILRIFGAWGVSALHGPEKAVAIATWPRNRPERARLRASGPESVKNSELTDMYFGARNGTQLTRIAFVR